jgi:phosphotransferase system HPr (HPr) family protein
MVIKEVRVKSIYGIHARPSRAIVLAARNFPKTKITLVNNDTKEKADASSILELMSIALECEAIVTVKVEGDNEEDAANAIVTIIQTFEVESK